MMGRIKVFAFESSDIGEQGFSNLRAGLQQYTTLRHVIQESMC